MALPVALVLTATACSGDDDPEAGGGGDPGEQSIEDATLEYAECMRDNGFDLPDPQGADLEVEITPENEAAYEAANRECEPILADAVGEFETDPEATAEELDRLTTYAECMRALGYDVADPVVRPDGGVGIDESGSAEGAAQAQQDEDSAGCEDEAGLTTSGPAGEGD